MAIYSGFSHETWWIFPVRYVKLPEGSSFKRSQAFWLFNIALENCLQMMFCSFTYENWWVPTSEHHPIVSGDNKPS